MDVSYFLWASENLCKFDQLSDMGNDIIFVITRSFTYVYWLFPVIYVFWPKDRWCGGKEGENDDEISEAFNRLASHIKVDGSEILYLQ